MNAPHILTLLFVASIGTTVVAMDSNDNAAKRLEKAYAIMENWRKNPHYQDICLSQRTTTTHVRCRVTQPEEYGEETRFFEHVVHDNGETVLIQS